MSKKIRGSFERPRLRVFRSNKHIYAQIIDDTTLRTIITASSLSEEIRSSIESSASCDAARTVGKLIAQKCIKKGFTKVVFDRGNKLYHGRIKALAESTRKAGINF